MGHTYPNHVFIIRYALIDKVVITNYWNVPQFVQYRNEKSNSISPSFF